MSKITKEREKKIEELIKTKRIITKKVEVLIKIKCEHRIQYMYKRQNLRETFFIEITLEYKLLVLQR